MPADTCVMPDGDCSSCHHCGQDEAICTATEEYKATCPQDCSTCDYCDEGEAFCDLEDGFKLSGMLSVGCINVPHRCTRELSEYCMGCLGLRDLIFEMRRYLYRNVACEARKLSDIARHMPDVPGWS